MAKYIVTGSEGFIGKALVAFLVAGGHEVIGIDRKNGDEASDIGKFLVSNDGVDGVFHLAAQTSVFNTETEQIRKDHPELPACESYDDLLALIRKAY